MGQGLMRSAQSKKIDEPRAMGPKTLTQEEKMILSIAYDEAPRAPRSDSRRPRSDRRDHRSPPRNNRGHRRGATPLSWTPSFFLIPAPLF